MAIPERYQRNLSSLSEEECALLARSRVVVVGCGGLGGHVIEALARAGVGFLRVVDGDEFARSNLNRQLLCTEDVIGRKKVAVAAERVRAVNSDVTVELVDTFVDEENAPRILAGADVVVDCLDSLEARFWTARACQCLGIPIVYGAIAGWFGQACTVYPGDVSFATVYGEPTDAGCHKELGNLSPTALAIAAIQSAEAIKVLLGRPGQIRNRLLMVDLLDGSVEDVILR